MAGLFELKIKVNVPPEELWSILVDFPSYAEWNPFVAKIEGKAEVGSFLHLHLNIDPKLRALRLSKEMIVSIKKNEHIGSDAHIFSSSLYHRMRWQMIHPADGGRSSFYHTQVKLSGLLSWPLSRLFGDILSQGLKASALALKNTAETKAANKSIK